jgi:hypothetical protein
MKSEKSPAKTRKKSAAPIKKSAKSFPPVPFLVCPRRKNKPKIQPVVCEKRCRDKRICPAYYAYVQPALFKKSDFSSKRTQATTGRKPKGKVP